MLLYIIKEGDFVGKELFDNIPSKVGDLLSDVKNGKVGLPDLQRPFVWKDNKARDLLDSMLKGYPIGYIMLWQSPDGYETINHIGTNDKTYIQPDYLVIDGQQRLTALLAAISGIKVKDKNYSERQIRIAFNPITREFAVWTEAYERNPEWISGISAVFEADANHDVPKFRRQGMGRELLAEAERLVKPRVSMLEAEFFGGAEELSGIFETSGFACIPGEPIYDYDVKKLLSNKQYAKYCQSRLSGIKTFNFTQLTQAQKNHIFNLLREHGERNTEANTAGFSPELSIAVYRAEDMRVPRACLIASVYKDQVTIAQLYGSGKNSPKFILATIFGFTDAVKQNGGNNSFKDLSMVAAHPGVKKVFELLFGKRLKANESGLLHAIKLIV